MRRGADSVSIAENAGRFVRVSYPTTPMHHSAYPLQKAMQALTGTRATTRRVCRSCGARVSVAPAISPGSVLRITRQGNPGAGIDFPRTVPRCNAHGLGTRGWNRTCASLSKSFSDPVSSRTTLVGLRPFHTRSCCDLAGRATFAFTFGAAGARRMKSRARGGVILLKRGNRRLVGGAR